MRKRYVVLSVFLIALALRLFLIPNRGFEADIAFWKSWGLSALDNGVVEGIVVTNNNYPTPFSYFLAFLVYVYRLFANPHIFNDFWNSGNMLFLTISKLPTILADLGIALIILLIGRNPGRFGFPDFSSQTPTLRLSSGQSHDLRPTTHKLFYLLLAILYLFNPVSLFDGALWGQVDALGVCIFLLAVTLAASDKPLLAGAVFTLSMMTKLQNMIYGPLFFLLLWQLGSFKGLLRGILGATMSFVFLNGEFFLKKNASAVFDSLTSNYDYFPLMSLNAFNLWWIVAKGQGMTITDKLLSVGMINAKTTGLLLFSTGYLLAALTMVKETLSKMWNKSPFEEKSARTKYESVSDTHEGSWDILYRFFTALIIVCFSFFLFQTESHDRYAFPVSVFALLWGAFYVYRTNTGKNRMSWWKTKSFQTFIIGYIVFSILFFLNLHTALSYNYPENSIAALIFLGATHYTILIAIFQLACFFLFLILVRKTIGIFTIAFCLIVFLSSCLLLNLPLFLKSPVSLTKFTPHISQQGYGMRTTNMAVHTNSASKNWNRLSVQYSFYKTGIGTHASSYIVYDINGLFKRFTADIGIDTQAGDKGSVVFKVFGDDQLLYESEKIKRFEYPRSIDINISGVKKFALIVDDGGDGISDDHADWLNPLLWPK